MADEQSTHLDEGLYPRTSVHVARHDDLYAIWLHRGESASFISEPAARELLTQLDETLNLWGKSGVVATQPGLYWCIVADNPQTLHIAEVSNGLLRRTDGFWSLDLAPVIAEKHGWRFRSRHVPKPPR